MKLIISLLFAWSLILLFPIQTKAQGPVQARPATFTNSHITYRIITVANGTFCYDIFTDDHRLIHQVSVPGLPGNKGFLLKKDAEKVARLIVQKLNKNIMPPTVTMHELDSLKIKY